MGVSSRSPQPGILLRRILLATDFTLGSGAAMAQTAALARKFAAQVEVAHIIEIQPWEVCPELTLQHRINAFQQMDAVLLSDVWNGIGVIPVIRHGGAASQIVRFAQEHPVDLIVTGTSSRNSLTHLLLGSVGEELVQTAPCPVLTVGPHMSRTPNVDEPAFRNIVLATGANAGAAAGIKYAAQFAEKYGAKLWIAHSLRRNDGCLQMDSERAWLKRLAPHKDRITTVFDVGSVAQVAVELAERESADLVMLAPGLGWLLPTIIKRVLCPVMTVRYATPMLRPKTLGAEIVK